MRLIIPTSPLKHMMHNSLHQFPALGLRLSQTPLKFIVEGHELVYCGEDRVVVCSIW